MNVLVIGFGNAGSGIAGDLALKGHTVSTLKTSHAMHVEHFDRAAVNRSVMLVEHGAARTAGLAVVTRSPQEAFGTKPHVIIVTTQTLEHDRVFAMIRPFLSPGMVLLLEPGNAGSFILGKGGLPEGVVVVEATSTPVDVRIREPGVVDVLFRNVRNPLGFLPQVRSHEALERLRGLYPNFYSLGHTLAVALHNPNLVVHTVGCLLSVPRIEYSRGEFWMYKEGFTPSVWNVIESLDAEKMAVLKCVGAEPISYLEMAKVRNAEDLTIDARKMFEIYCETGSPKGPASISTRYVYEDVPKGLVLLESIGGLVNCRTPTASMLIDLAQTYTRRDFRKLGSTLSRLGISGYTVQDLLRWLETGSRPGHAEPGFGSGGTSATV